IPARVDPDGMAAIDLASPCRTHPPGYDLPVECKESDQSVQLGDIHDLVGIDIDVARAGEASPLAQEVPLRGETVDAVVRPVRHQYGAVAMRPDPVGHMQFTRRAFSWRSP